MNLQHSKIIIDYDFMKNVHVTHGQCWQWKAYKNPDGYGRYYDKKIKKCVLAHRYSFSISISKIEIDMEIDHLCRNRWCVNPAHLEQVTHKENVRRGLLLKTHCKYGHEFTIENTYFNKQNRTCKICMTSRNRNRKKKNFGKIA